MRIGKKESQTARNGEVKEPKKRERHGITIRLRIGLIGTKETFQKSAKKGPGKGTRGNRLPEMEILAVGMPRTHTQEKKKVAWKACGEKKENTGKFGKAN